MVARFQLWFQNILAANNRWYQVALKYSSGYTVASTSVSFCKLGKYYIAYLMMMHSLAVIHGTPCLYPFTKFTDQQSHTCALLNLTHVAIQVVYINTFHEMFVVCQILTPMVEVRR